MNSEKKYGIHGGLKNNGKDADHTQGRAPSAGEGYEFSWRTTPPNSQQPRLGKIPAFEDGDLVICDSSVIVEYLEEQYPDIPIRPGNIAERARSRWLEEYGSALFAPCAAGIFMEQMTKPFSTGESPDLSVVENAINNLVPPVFGYVESQLPPEGFLFGEMSIADIALISPIINATYTDFEVDGDRWPKLAAHVKLVKAHPAVFKCLQAEEPLITALRNANEERSAR